MDGGFGKGVLGSLTSWGIWASLSNGPHVQQMEEDTLGGQPTLARCDVAMLLLLPPGNVNELLNPWETAAGTEFAWLLKHLPKKRTLRCRWRRVAGGLATAGARGAHRSV